MRSLIILEVEHGEDTDALNVMTKAVGLLPPVELRDYRRAPLDRNRPPVFSRATIIDYAVKVDIPDCFRLDS